MERHSSVPQYDLSIKKGKDKILLLQVAEPMSWTKADHGSQSLR